MAGGVHEVRDGDRMGREGLTIVIPGRLTGANEYVRANRSSPRHGARIKKEETARVAGIAAGAGRVEGPYRLRVTWHERDRRRDVDNVEFAVKFILDGLVEARVVEGDGQAFLRRIDHRVEVDEDDPRVVVEVIPER